MLKEEIKEKYKILHDDLSKTFYEKKRNGGVAPQEQADFDAQHSQIWIDCEAEIKTASDYIEPTPSRDVYKELDELKTKVAELEALEKTR